jgi:hypothetical protein
MLLAALKRLVAELPQWLRWQVAKATIVNIFNF